VSIQEIEIKNLKKRSKKKKPMLYRQIILSNKGLYCFMVITGFSLVPFCLWQQNLQINYFNIFRYGKYRIYSFLGWLGGKALQRIAFLWHY